MKGSVAYSLVRRRDFKAPDGDEKLYYAQAQARGEMGICEFLHNELLSFSKKSC